jgi:hypothetical protein
MPKSKCLIAEIDVLLGQSRELMKKQTRPRIRRL